MSVCVCVCQQEARGEAHSHWLAAAAVAGSHQAGAFAKLGLWYADFKSDKPRARKCFQRGLGLNPLEADAGWPCLHFSCHCDLLISAPMQADVCMLMYVCQQHSKPYNAKEHCSQRCKQQQHTVAYHVLWPSTEMQSMNFTPRLHR